MGPLGRVSASNPRMIIHSLGSGLSLALVFFALVAMPSSVSAQQPSAVPQAAAERRSVLAMRMTDGERIALDGVLDEAVWKRADPAKDFIQIDPQNGEPATEPTEVRIVFGADALYLGV